jgi:hypothetical protein
MRPSSAFCFAYAERLVLSSALLLYRKRCGSNIADHTMTISHAAKSCSRVG